MTVDDLKSNLSKHYSIKGIADLSDLSTSPGSVYKFFYSLYQDTFEPNDRIIIYTSCDIPDKLLKHIYDAANFVDISNWFILFCTPDDFPNKSQSNDLIPFQHLKVPLNKTRPLEDNFWLPDTICAIPWTNLEIKNDGEMSPCCMTVSAHLGNINTVSIDDAFRSSNMEKLRSQLLAGEKPSVCNRCWTSESQGLSSIRTHNIKRLKKEFLLNYLETPQVTNLDIKFNNTCNFKCRECNPFSSSLISAEQKKFLGIKLLPQPNWGESDIFLNQMIEKLPQLTNIDMYGGEPFLIKKFINVLKLAVDQGHSKNIRLHYNSNGSIWPGEFIEYWKHFKEVDIHFSIDAIGKRFELQRGGSWEEVESNILRIKNLNLPNINICLMPTINIMSVYYLDEVYDWAKEHGFELYVSHLVTPVNFNIKNLTREAQQIILEKFKDHPWSEIQNILAAIRTTPPTDGSLFRKKTKWFDSIRQENFADSHFEIAKAMGYIV